MSMFTDAHRNAGFSQFMDTPRYSTGYTSFVEYFGVDDRNPHAKPYDERVYATQSMLESLINLSADEQQNIKTKRADNFKAFQKDDYYKFGYVVDSTQFETLDFKGYEAEYILSDITDQKRLKYDTTKPFSKPVKYFNHFKPRFCSYSRLLYRKISLEKVIHHFKQNNIEMQILEKDSLMNVETYRIADFKTSNSAYEGHYLHYETEVTSTVEKQEFKKGDVMIPTRQDGIKYIIETLEPETKDSFFNWNFFDSILQRKEGFSAYVFEDYAEEFLKNNPDVKWILSSKKRLMKILEITLTPNSIGFINKVHYMKKPT